MGDIGLFVACLRVGSARTDFFPNVAIWSTSDSSDGAPPRAFFADASADTCRESLVSFSDNLGLFHG